MLTVDALGLPQADRLQLSPSPLRFVVCQVRFSPILALTTPGGVATFQETIRDRYPLAQPEMEVAALIAAGRVPQQQEAHLWRFQDVSRHWSVVLGSDFIGIETHQYTDFAEFRGRFDHVLLGLGRAFQPAFLTRIGLRFIDEIRGESGRTAEWRDVVHPSFLGPLALGNLGSLTVQSLQELQLRFGNGEAVTVRHGLLPEGTTVQPLQNERPPAGPFYLIDLDASRTFEPTEGIAMDGALVLEHVDRYHDALYQIFRAVVTQGYVERLAPRGAS